MRSTILSIIFSCSIAGCSSIPKPDTNLLGVNKKAGKLRGYNLRDYDDEGNRKKDAKVVERPLTDITDGWICTDPTGFKNLKVYVGDLRDELKKRCD